ncbi:hypothetical protein AB0L25_21840 [Spirillospora sp. NPDC052242]
MRAAEFGHHDRVAAHPDVSVDIAQFDITKTHANLLLADPVPSRHVAGDRS